MEFGNSEELRRQEEVILFNIGQKYLANDGLAPIRIPFVSPLFANVKGQKGVEVFG